MATATATPICFGNVVKLYAKAGDDAKCMGFLESKGNEHLLVVPPAKDDGKRKFHEAEFIIAPTRCEKPPADGTPLNYKQPFVLMTSSKFEEYSLNNKMNNEDTIGLQCRDVKGEMYLTIEKEGYTMEANVMDEDAGLDIVVVDSNRMRKKYNKKLASYTKNKCEYISCGSKGKALSLKIVKVPGATTTKQFVQTKIERRRSTLTQAKAEEISRANRVGSDASDGGALSPTGTASAPVPVEATPTGDTESVGSTAAEASDMAAIDSIPEGSGSTASTAESTASSAETTAVAPAPALAATEVVAVTLAADVPPAPLVEMLSDVALEDKTVDAAAPAIVDLTAVTVAVAESVPVEPLKKDTETLSTDSAAPAVVEPAKPSVAATLAAALPPPALATNAAKTESKAAAPTPLANGAAVMAVPMSPKKLAQQQSSMTVTSEAEGAGEEKVESTCLGGNSCSVM